MRQHPVNLWRLLSILATVSTILTPGHNHPLTESPDTRFRPSTLLKKICRRIMTVPDIDALTDPEEMILVHKSTIVQLTKRSTYINKSSMKAMRSIWAYNMTSPRYRRTINPHEVVVNTTMSAKEVTDLQFLRWREPFLLSPKELNYYGLLRKKFHFNHRRQCPSCRQIVLDTYEQYNQHSFEYGERGYVIPVTADRTIRYPHRCYICPTMFETSDEINRHYVTHSIQFKKHPTWTYPYTAVPTLAGRKTSIVVLGDQPLYYNVWPQEDESTEFPKWIRTPNIG